jgi:hypothetical protein
MVKDQHPAAVQEATDVVLPQWLDAFRVLLDSDSLVDVQDSLDWSGLTPKIQIVRVSSA